MVSSQSRFLDYRALEEEITKEWSEIHKFLILNDINSLYLAIKLLDMLNNFATWYKQLQRKLKGITLDDCNKYIYSELEGRENNNITAIGIILKQFKAVADNPSLLGEKEKTNELFKGTGDKIHGWGECLTRLGTIVNAMPVVGQSKYKLTELKSVPKTYLRHQVIKSLMNPEQHSELLGDVGTSRENTEKDTEKNHGMRIRQLYSVYLDYATHVDEKMVNPFVARIEKANVSISSAFKHSKGLTDFAKNAFTNRHVQLRKSFRDDLRELKNNLKKAQTASDDEKLLATATFKEKLEELIKDYNSKITQTRRSLTLFSPRSELQGHLEDFEALKPARQYMLFACQPKMEDLHQSLKKKRSFSLSRMLLCG